MRIVIMVCLILVQVGCANDSDNVQGDCRTLAGACNAEFRCESTPAGQYECIPATATSDEPTADVDGGMSPTTESQADEDEMSVPADASAPVSDAESDAAQPSPEVENSSMDAMQMNEEAEIEPSPEPTRLGDDGVCNRIGIVGPVLPAEAGHRAATILTPTVYPYEVGSIRYELLTPEDTASCTSALAHTTEIMVIAESNGLPATPGEQMLRFRSYSVPADDGADDGRAVELTLPIPMYLAQGEQLVVSVELAASQNRHLCLSRCLDYDAAPGTDWWSNAAQPPYNWSDLIVDYNFKGALRIQAFPVDSGAN